MNAIIKLGGFVLKYGRRKPGALEITPNIKNEKGYRFEKYAFIQLKGCSFNRNIQLLAK